jgi:hypothetical protein
LVARVGRAVVGIIEEVAVAGIEVDVTIGNGVPVANEAPGVRKRFIQPGGVRMDCSIGSMKLLGRRVRKSLFGSRFESISVCSSQLGEK